MSKPGNFLRYVLLPVAALAAGVKLGLEYSKDHYVVRDKKFIEGKIIKEKK